MAVEEEELSHISRGPDQVPVGVGDLVLCGKYYISQDRTPVAYCPDCVRRLLALIAESYYNQEGT